MMVDDIYAVVGSANINQRSMDGRRDTEIAVGCFETGDSETDLVTNGHVQGLRKVRNFTEIANFDLLTNFKLVNRSI